MIRNISGAILAGGASKRFNGIIKSQIVIDGKTIISRILEIFGEIFDEVIIVTNTPEEFKEYSNCKITGDQILNKGPLGGIHSALKISEDEAVFLAAGDMPLLNREIIIRQIDFYRAGNCDVLIPKIGHYIEPLHGIYRKTLLSTLEEYLTEKNDYAIREFLRSVDTHYMHLGNTKKNRRAFTNINSSEDIINVQKLQGND
jgi:molybdopterin-guanine dinucleotide biosynthesis protein A